MTHSDKTGTKKVCAGASVNVNKKMIALKIAEGLCSLGGTDKDHTILQRDMSSELKKRLDPETLKALNPPSKEYAEAFKSGIKFLRENNAIQEIEKRFYLTPHGKWTLERHLKSTGKESQLHTKTECEPKKRPREGERECVTEKPSFEPSTGGNLEKAEKEEEPLTIKELYVYAIYLLTEEKQWRIGFKNSEIYFKILEINKDLSGEQLPEGYEALTDNINDGNINGNKSKFKLTLKGLTLAKEISARFNTPEPPRKRQKL